MESSKESTNTLSLLEALPFDHLLHVLSQILPNQLLSLQQTSKTMKANFPQLLHYLQGLGINKDDVTKKLSKRFYAVRLRDLAQPTPFMFILLQDIEAHSGKTLTKAKKKELRDVVCDLLFCVRFGKHKLIENVGIPDALKPEEFSYLLKLLNVVQAAIFMDIPKDEWQDFLDTLYSRFERYLKGTFKADQPAVHKQQHFRLMAICNQSLELFPTQFEADWNIDRRTQRLFKALRNRSWGRNANDDLEKLVLFISQSPGEDVVYCLYALRQNKQFSTEPGLVQKPNLANDILETLLQACLRVGGYAESIYILSNFPYPNPDDMKYTVGIERWPGDDSLILESLDSQNANFSVLSQYFDINLGQDNIPQIRFDKRAAFCRQLLHNPGLFLLSEKKPEFWKTEFGGYTPGYTLVRELALYEPLSDTQKQHRRLDLLKFIAAQKPEALLLQRRLIDAKGDVELTTSAIEELMNLLVKLQYDTHSNRGAMQPKKPTMEFEAYLKKTDRYLDIFDTILKNMKPVKEPGLLCPFPMLLAFLEHLDSLHTEKAALVLKAENPYRLYAANTSTAAIAKLYHKYLKTCILLFDALAAEDRKAFFEFLKNSKSDLSKDHIFTFLEKAYTKIERGNEKTTAKYSATTKDIQNKELYRALLDELKSDTPNGSKLEELSQNIRAKSNDEEAKLALKIVLGKCPSFTTEHASSSSTSQQEKPVPK